MRWQSLFLIDPPCCEIRTCMPYIRTERGRVIREKTVQQHKHNGSETRRSSSSDASLACVGTLWILVSVVCLRAGILNPTTDQTADPPTDDDDDDNDDKTGRQCIALKFSDPPFPSCSGSSLQTFVTHRALLADAHVGVRRPEQVVGSDVPRLVEPPGARLGRVVRDTVGRGRRGGYHLGGHCVGVPYAWRGAWGGRGRLQSFLELGLDCRWDSGVGHNLRPIPRLEYVITFRP